VHPSKMTLLVFSISTTFFSLSVFVMIIPLVSAVYLWSQFSNTDLFFFFLCLEVFPFLILRIHHSFISMKNDTEILMGTVVNLHIAFGSHFHTIISANLGTYIFIFY
jgi:hypothetical protein